LNYD